MKSPAGTVLCLALGAMSGVDASMGEECSILPNDNCRTRVKVNVSDIIGGFVDHVPKEVLEAYVATSSECLRCVSTENLLLQTIRKSVNTMNTGNHVCDEDCDWCGSIYEKDANCASCCGERCMGCDWALGEYTDSHGSRVCDDGCVEPSGGFCHHPYSQCVGCQMSYEGTNNCKDCCGVLRCQGCNGSSRSSWDTFWYGDLICDSGCPAGGRRLEDIQPTRKSPKEYVSIESESGTGTPVYYSIDVCMDDIAPLDPTMSSYTDYRQLLDDFGKQLYDCVQEPTPFLNRWDQLSADSGVDLNMILRDTYDPGNRDTMLLSIDFGNIGIESSYAEVTSYDSSNSHRATSHMMFYGALGFVTLSAFAVASTAVVVHVFNRRKLAHDEQASTWISELADVTSTPVSEA